MKVHYLPAIIVFCSMTNLVIIVELLSKHAVQFEVCIPPEPQYSIIVDLCLIRVVQILIKLALFSLLHQ